MKKIMFNDKMGLTQAVLDGRKTMTRREIKLKRNDEEYLDTAFDWDLRESVIMDRYSRYKVGEVVAVAQRYDDIPLHTLATLAQDIDMGAQNYANTMLNKGRINKMFVNPNLMPHHIKITNIRVERLQDISDEDCLREGIEEFYGNDANKCKLYNYPYGLEPKFTPRDAFASLIDKVSSKGTWERNPYCFIYEFELVD